MEFYSGVFTFVSSFVLYATLHRSICAYGYELSISSTKFVEGQSMVLRKGETLNLTCTVTSPVNQSMPNFRMSWHTPINPKNSVKRQIHNVSINALNLIVHNLQENDGGDYKCEADTDDESQMQLNEAVFLIVKNKKMCGSQMFQCPNGICILKRFLCDGHQDCKSGADESMEECGPNPCESKLHCDDGRCIPIQWCCDSYHEPNCTVKVIPKCCHQLSKESFMDHDAGYMTEQQRFSDMGFLQTTIYTVIGCAMAFMFIVTILVIAICRVHMKHSLLSRCPAAGGRMMGPGLAGRRHHHHHHGLQHIPLYDLDVLLNRSPYPSASSHQVPGSGLLSTGYDMQLVGHPVDPPPYCEVVPSPPREGPPPPYASREATPSPTLTTAATNEASEGDSLLGSSEDNWVASVCVCSSEQSCQSIGDDVMAPVPSGSSSDLQVVAELISEGAALPKVDKSSFPEGDGNPLQCLHDSVVEGTITGKSMTPSATEDRSLVAVQPEQ